MFSQIQREIEADRLKKAKEQKIITDLTGRINVEWMLHLYRLMFAYTSGSNEIDDPWQYHSKILLIYIYSVINGSQILLQKISEIYSDNKYLQELQKSTYLSEAEILSIKNEIAACRTRFNVYDGIIKQLFNIPLKEFSWTQIVNSFPTFEYFTNYQVTELKEKIIDPIFGVKDDHGNICGYFRKVFNTPLMAVSCNINVNTAEKTMCKAYSVSKFPYPEQTEYTCPYPDCIVPIVLWNELVSNIKFSIKLERELGFFAKIFNKLTGLTYGEYYAEGADIKKKKDWVDKQWEDGKEAAANVAAAAAEIAKQGADIGRSVANFVQNPPKPSDLMKTVLLLTAVGGASFILINTLLESK